jgi:hypothetical protein
VKPVKETPTEPVDYAVLSATYGALLTTLAYASRRREASLEPIAPAELAPLGLATFALSKTLVHEKVETWLRAPFVEEHRGEKRPRGRGLRYAVGELFTCTRCMGTWSALGLVALRLGRPAAGRSVIAVLAAAGANDFLQAEFSRACARAKQADADTPQSAPERRSPRAA